MPSACTSLPGRWEPDATETRTIRRSIVRAGLHMYEAAYAPRSSLAEHAHGSPFFTYVLRGDYLEQLAQSCRRCTRGTVIFHHEHEEHSNAVGQCGTASLNVEIPL